MFLGEWITRVYYDNEEVKGSPYVFEAFDLNLAVLNGLKFGQSQYQINKQISFQGKNLLFVFSQRLFFNYNPIQLIF